MADLIIQSFNAGELSPLLDGRSDLEKYYSGVRIGDNMIPLPYGPAERRPGTYFVAECKDSTKKARLVSFQYSTEQAYIHEFGDQYIRFYKDRGQIISLAGTENLGSVDGDCVGHWKMNDDAADTNIVDSKNANTGTSQRDTDELTTIGAANDALIFSGVNDYITIPDNANYDFAAAFTLAGWVNSDIAIPDTPRQILHRYDGTSEDGYRVTLTTAGKLEFAVFVGGTETSIVSDSALSSGWHFFTATRDADGVMKLYIDSVLQEDTDTLSGAIDSDGDLLLGIPSERDDLGSVDGDCVLYWKMDDNAADTDVVETQIGATRKGTAQQNTEDIDTTGVINGALTYNGSSDYVEVADCAELDFADAFSIALWVKPNRLGHTADQFVLSRYGGASNDGYYIYQTTTDKWCFGTLVDSGFGVSVFSNSPATGDWQFLVGTRDAAGNMKLYVDGVLQTDTDINVGAISTNSVLNIGRRSWNTDAYFDGTVDATMLFDKDLSLTEANELYAKGKKFAGKLDNLMIFDKGLSQTEVTGFFTESTYEIGSPYLEADLFGLQHVQSADVLYNTHSDYAPAKLKRYAHDNWELENIVFDWPPFLLENITDTTITPSATTGSITLTASTAIFTSNHVGSYWLIKHPRSDNKVEKQLTDVYAGASYVKEGITDILVDVKGSFRLRTSDAWTGTVELERSYDNQLVLVLDAAPASGAWNAGDIITGGTSTDTCIIVSVTDSTHYVIKQLTGSFTDDETLTAQDGNARACAATWPRYEGWHTLETFVSVQDQNFNAPGEETLGNAYLRAKRTVDSAGNDPTVLITVERYYHYGIVKITAVTDSTHATATVIRTIGSTDATKLWSEGAWTDERGYPVASVFFEGRQFYAGTSYRPLNIWGSRVEDYENMGIGTLDDDAVQYTVDAAMQNMIRWLVAHEVLLIGTSGGEWRLGSVDPADAITPTNPMRPKEQTSYGSKKIQALLLANAVLFVDAQGRRVRGAQYIFEKGEAGGYDAPDYTMLAEHITESGIVDMAYQQNPYPILWCVRDDGVLIGMVFEPGQKVWGWFKCVIDGDVESVAVIPGVTEDEVWIIVKREINGSDKRYIEYFKPRDWGDDQADCFFVDSGLTFDGGDAVTITGITKADPCVVTAVNTFSDGEQIKLAAVIGMTEVNNKAYTVSNPTSANFELRDKLDTVDIDSTGFTVYVSDGTAQKVENAFSGLDHLEGKAVSVLGDGSVHADVVVSSGAVTLTDYFNKVHMGLPYTSKLMPMKLAVPGAQIRGKKKRIHQIIFSFYKTLGAKFGTTEGNEIIPFRKTTDPMGSAPPLFTDEKEQTFPGGYELNGDIFVSQDQPLPMTVRTIIAKLGVYG